MRVAELNARGDAASSWLDAVEVGFEGVLGRPVSLTAEHACAGQRWWLQPTLNACFVDGASPVVRRFLRDSFRFTRVRWRMGPQLALGTALASGPGLRMTRQAAFVALPAIGRAEDRLVVPGNQRVRLFDFGRGVVRVVLKPGFDASAMSTEVAVRGPGQVGPFPNLTEVDPDLGWFEEPILDGYDLSRCPPWLSHDALAAQALTDLEGWTLESARTADPAGWAQQLRAQIEPWVVPGRLVAAASELTGFCVGPSHGDAQAGNVRIDRAGTRPLWTDWEWQDERAWFYDRLVFALRVRWPTGLDDRLRSFISGRDQRPSLGRLRGHENRRAVAAMLILEELALRARLGRQLPSARTPELHAVMDAAAAI